MIFPLGTAGSGGKFLLYVILDEEQYYLTLQYTVFAGAIFIQLSNSPAENKNSLIIKNPITSLKKKRNMMI